jgi:hypothetical protein
MLELLEVELHHLDIPDMTRYFRDMKTAIAMASGLQDMFPQAILPHTLHLALSQESG